MSGYNPSDKPADFTGYLKKDQKTTTPVVPVSPIQEYQRKPLLTSRAKFLLILLLILAVVQSVLLITLNFKKAEVKIPAGYRLVTPTNQPAHLERIK
ncbi:MAG TPA: hypothetical protein VHQ41_02095 [Patescibacteria group bacterium]|jgi:hypothetical protein|nr:hypothetical protein [Patescibacteria group bacterium]